MRQTCIPPEEPLDLDEQHPSLSSWPVMRTPGVVMQFDDSQGPIQTQSEETHQTSTSTIKSKHLSSNRRAFGSLSHPELQWDTGTLYFPAYHTVKFQTYHFPRSISAAIINPNVTNRYKQS